MGLFNLQTGHSQNCIEAIDANPWPLYQDAVIHYSLRGKGRLFSPDRSVPSFVGLHALSATEVQTFVARWPEWLVEAVPMIAESIAVELSMDVVPLSDDC